MVCGYGAVSDFYNSKLHQWLLKANIIPSHRLQSLSTISSVLAIRSTFTILYNTCLDLCNHLSKSDAYSPSCVVSITAQIIQDVVLYELKYFTDAEMDGAVSPKKLLLIWKTSLEATVNPSKLTVRESK